MFSWRRRVVAMPLMSVAMFGWHSGRMTVFAVPSTCAFRFEGYLNISEPPTWTVPSAMPFSDGYTVLNQGVPIVYFVNDTAGDVVNCTGFGWQYLAVDTWMTEVAYPDKEPTNGTEFEDIFSVVNGSDLLVAPVPAAVAVAVSDSLYGRDIQVNLTCDVDVVVEESDSCVIFQVDFTNYSPMFNATEALYRFEDPAVPAFALPDAQPDSPGDIRLNHNNPITDLDGSETDTACNGDIAEYLGEDGLWYFWYTGSDGNMYNLTHVFYAVNTSHLNIATIQKTWSTNMEAALYNRTVRLLIHCNNEVNFEEGYLFFNIGETETLDDLEITCESLPDLCIEAAATSAAATNILYRSTSKIWIIFLGFYVVTATLASGYMLSSSFAGL